MAAFLQRLCSTKVFPLSWTFLIIVLLCLPGSAIPGSGFFAIEGLDKVVHIILFGGLVLFWGIYIRQRYNKPWAKMILWIALLSIGLGIFLEYIQLYFVSNRSFDSRDIIADTIGSLIVFIFFLFSNINK